MCGPLSSFDPPVEQKVSSTNSTYQSDVSIYGKRQTLLRFFQISFIIFFFFVLLLALSLRLILQPAMISCDDGCDVCSNPKNQHTKLGKSAHRDQAITSLWSKESGRKNKVFINFTNLSRFMSKEEIIKITATWNVDVLENSNSSSSSANDCPLFDDGNFYSFEM